MARIRSIKPGFFTSEDVAELSMRARLTWIGLWTYCDDDGRGKDNARLIKAAIWSLEDVTLRDVEQDLAELANCGRIARYQFGGRNYLAVTNWKIHQHPNHPTKSALPAPPEVDSGNTPVVLPASSGNAPVTLRVGGERSGGEGRGVELARARDRPGPRTPSTADQRSNAGIALAEHFEAQGM